MRAKKIQKNSHPMGESSITSKQSKIDENNQKTFNLGIFNQNTHLDSAQQSFIVYSFKLLFDGTQIDFRSRDNESNQIVIASAQTFHSLIQSASKISWWTLNALNLKIKCFNLDLKFYDPCYKIITDRQHCI
jgi:hypothetical protein